MASKKSTSNTAATLEREAAQVIEETTPTVDTIATPVTEAPAQVPTVDRTAESQFMEAFFGIIRDEFQKTFGRPLYSSDIHYHATRYNLGLSLRASAYRVAAHQLEGRILPGTPEFKQQRDLIAVQLMQTAGYDPNVKAINITPAQIKAWSGNFRAQNGAVLDVLSSKSAQTPSTPDRDW
ncbi:hypothetical protein [Leptolyngbya sp. NIES-2104]|uniref:hypothetical protein n=1 Tax=Leptolyngbya sp. NIES-2104 TaxID=1552121 RepID=UPI0006EC7940|nr:hypothetical protein [Leptolyngbya sp. NIES-2104]GAP99674.1 hypothetical protein NIES2104_62400 [Leptolyngbya sp. NIES-2104]